MYQVATYNTIKTLLAQGRSIRAISRELYADRKTVTRIRNKIPSGIEGPPVQTRSRLLSDYKDYILSLLEKGLSGRLIYQKL